MRTSITRKDKNNKRNKQIAYHHVETYTYITYNRIGTPHGVLFSQRGRVLCVVMPLEPSGRPEWMMNFGSLSIVSYMYAYNKC